MKRLQSELAATSDKRKDAEGRMFAERQERARVAELDHQHPGDIEDLQKQAETYQRGWTTRRAGRRSWR